MFVIIVTLKIEHFQMINENLQETLTNRNNIYCNFMFDISFVIWIVLIILRGFPGDKSTTCCLRPCPFLSSWFFALCRIVGSSALITCSFLRSYFFGMFGGLLRMYRTLRFCCPFHFILWGKYNSDSIRKSRHFFKTTY